MQFNIRQKFVKYINLFSCLSSFFFFFWYYSRLDYFWEMTWILNKDNEHTVFCDTKFLIEKKCVQSNVWFDTGATV